jgi:uncharacterized protein with PIN domain
MSPSDNRCPLCGAEFTKSEERCHACPMGRRCDLVCCPNCGYGFPAGSRLVRLAKKLFRPPARHGKTGVSPKDEGKTGGRNHDGPTS